MKGCIEKDHKNNFKKMIRIKGVVTGGKREGRQYGFPTVNIKIQEKLESAVYEGKVKLGRKTHKAGIFISPDGLLEAHIIDFSGDLYGKEIELFIGKKIREARKFPNREELKNQIVEDVELISKLK